MEGQQSNIKSIAKSIGKTILKLFNKKFLVLLAVIGFIWFSLSGFYVKNKNDMDKVSETTSSCTATVNSNGQIEYVYKDPDDEEAEPVPITVEQIAEDLKNVLDGYIDGDDEYYQEKIQYIMGAEAVTRMPYIEQSAPEEVPEGGSDEVGDDAGTQLQGQIKFYRYSDEGQANDAYDVDGEGEKILKEEYRLTYVTPEEFKTLKENYENSGEEKVFEHFTIDDEGNIVIACGAKETRTVTTENDLDLTLDLINENSTEDSYAGNCNDGFSMVKYTISEKPIDYISLVERYIMPANLLYSLLIQTRDIDFVEQVASLAYENEIAIAIYDNISVTTRGENYAYQKVMSISGSVSINLSNVEITNPTINSNNLRTYPNLRYGTGINTYEGKTQYVPKYYSASHSTVSSTEKDNMYIVGTDNVGKITALGLEGESYTTKYTQVVERRGQPTVGVVLADTWIARWEATYKKADDNSPQPSPSSAGECPDTDVIEYTSTDEVINAFAESMNISTQLENHAIWLEEEAINIIIEGTNFEVAVEPETISRDDVGTDTRKRILQTHIDGCSACTSTINGWWQRINNGATLLSNTNALDVQILPLAAIPTIPPRPTIPTQGPTINDIYLAITSSNGALKGTTAEDHYWNSLDNYVAERNSDLEDEAEEEAAQRAEERKEEVRAELAEQIGNSKDLKGTKKYVAITYTPFFERDASNYEKGENLEPTKLGEKFSEVFNNDAFYDSRQAILEREEWFWEYIRANEDTGNLEDIIRILLNEATGSTKFGDLNINDILKAFEPSNMIFTSSMYGNSIETKIWCALLNEGYSEYAIAGVLGNLYQESNIQTNKLEYEFQRKLGYTSETYTEAVNEGMYNNGEYTIDDFISDHTSDNCGAGYGLAQWTWFSRKEGLYNYALSKGVRIDDEDMQIEYLISEITGSGAAKDYADYILTSRKADGREYKIEDWTCAETVEDATEAFCWIFENPEDPHMDTRKAKAVEYYEKYKDFDLGGVFERNTSGEEHISGEFTSSITGRTFTIFNQTKIPGWSDRCNRASQISVCSGYYSGDRNELIDKISSNAPGDTNVYGSCGLTFQNKLLSDNAAKCNYTFDEEQIKEQIQSGGYAIVYVVGYWDGKDGISKYNRDWASASHWVAILGYRELDSTREIFVSDSSDRGTGIGHTGWVPLDEFEGILKSVVFVNEK